MLRYCARPPFALDRLRELDPEHLLYENTQQGPCGNGPQLLTPLGTGHHPSAVPAHPPPLRYWRERLLTGTFGGELDGPVFRVHARDRVRADLHRFPAAPSEEWDRDRDEREDHGDPSDEDPAARALPLRGRRRREGAEPLDGILAPSAQHGHHEHEAAHV